jgi:hypothetical protein
VDTRRLKSPKNRPTMLMREIFRASGHIDDWKTTFASNEELLKGKADPRCAKYFLLMIMIGRVIH